MLIRPAVAADFDAIAAITNHYIRETTINWEYEPTTADVMRSGWESRRGTHPFLVGVEDAGAARLIGYARARTWRAAAGYVHTAEVGLYLAPQFHGRGLGRRLYADLIAACRDAGFHTLVGGISLPNDASVRLHEALGFAYVGTFRQVGWKSGQWLDAAFYQLELEAR